MKITIQLTNATAAKIRLILTTYITGSTLTAADIETAMTVLAAILTKLPPPKKP